MWDQEKEHLQKFEQIVADKRVRPTILIPLWNIAGYVLGEDDTSDNFLKVVIFQYREGRIGEETVPQTVCK